MLTNTTLIENCAYGDMSVNHGIGEYARDIDTTL